MACFIVPATEAIVVTAATLIVKAKEKKSEPQTFTYEAKDGSIATGEKVSFRGLCSSCIRAYLARRGYGLVSVFDGYEQSRKYERNVPRNGYSRRSYVCHRYSCLGLHGAYFKCN